ncbi:hypothetical protein JVT61DRAFT_2248 [Boletus reticuloceps]|uniref:Uncharacterized protein n=1 Tax=Boletus reticuloceps TaxID=495285 RepID=A0A8I2YR04_9AGAM|nr:hypothetical protein JVT61DRAFT_2248 [Boletus reticuloceps]
MTVDEYLEIERQRGGILSTGGSQSETKLPSSEQLTIDSEVDGTALGELKQKRNATRMNSGPSTKTPTQEVQVTL